MTTQESIDWYGRPDGDQLFDMADAERERCYRVFMATPGNKDSRKGFFAGFRRGVFSRVTGELIEY